MDNTSQFVAAASSADLAGLISTWRTRELPDWPNSPEIHRVLGERILSHGEPLLAYDVLAEGLMKWPDDVRLRQLQGLTLARSGATGRANAILEKLRSEGQINEETLGMLARTFKDQPGFAKNRHKPIAVTAFLFERFEAIPANFSSERAGAFRFANEQLHRCSVDSCLTPPSNEMRWRKFPLHVLIIASDRFLSSPPQLGPARSVGSRKVVCSSSKRN